MKLARAFRPTTITIRIVAVAKASPDSNPSLTNNYRCTARDRVEENTLEGTRAMVPAV